MLVQAAACELLGGGYPPLQRSPSVFRAPGQRAASREAHVVEGLADGRFAVYVKFHHALIDGVSALKLM